MNLSLPWGRSRYERLEEMGLGHGTARALKKLEQARKAKDVSEEGGLRLDALLPELLAETAKQTDPVTTLERVVPILRTVLRRSAYLVLLQENPEALRRLLDLVARSRWVAAQIERKPMYLDALLDMRDIHHLPSRDELCAALNARMAGVPEDDQEQQLDMLREFKQQHEFSVAVAELSATLVTMQVSDYHTWLAEALLEQAIEVAWRQCAGPEERPFLIVGYGKLGGLELGPGSDLDVVFVHDFEAQAGQDAATFLHRYARRLLHVLTAPTYLGPLYEIDTRLRPSGNAGTMISSLDAFAAYQRKQAWAWEHQALVRARPVAGDPALAARFVAVREELLCTPRDRQSLAGEVVKMRDRMVQHHNDEHSLKQAPGGIVDIEFMVQYLVLAHAHDVPALARYTDNVRILEAAAAGGVLAGPVTQRLTDAYLEFRAERHRQALDLPNPDRSAEVLAVHRQHVRDTWEELFGAGSSD